MNDTRFIELLNKAYQKAENLAPTDLLGLPDDFEYLEKDKVLYKQSK